MSYQVFARKWRPQKFQELVGQNHISQTLSNALLNGRLPQALLFTGPRGTGKTSSARILAKALRCPNAIDFVPCGSCDSCKEIASSRSTDVIEIDGASNNGVDSIRELREGVAFMPSSGKYKIYIIDEVHMLSTSAFNALLKTLEEPPEHVIFMMATTEAQKIPQTILSRCQRFDFRRISTRVIVDRMAFICSQESISVDEDALWIIARQGDGSMRDSLSLLDQVITFSNTAHQGALRSDKVVEILGLTDRTLLTGVLDFLLSRSTDQVLNLLGKISQSGTEPALFLNDLLELIRAALLTKISGEKPPEMLDLPDSEIRSLQELSRGVSEEDLHLLFDMALKGAQDLHRSSQPRIVLEMILLRMASAPQIIDLQKLLSGQPMFPPPNSAAIIRTGPVQAPTAPTKTSQTSSASQTALTPTEKWFELVQKIKSDDPLTGAKIENLLFIRINSGPSGKILELAVPQKMDFLKDQMSDPGLRKKLQIVIEATWGPGYAVEIKSEDKSSDKKSQGAISASGLAQVKEKQKEDDLFRQVSEHPKVKSAMTAFNGSVKIKPSN